MIPSMSTELTTTQSRFVDPFRTLGHTLAPMGIRELMLYAERIWTFYGRYANAQRRKIKYFLTEPMFEGDGFSDKEGANLSTYMKEHLRILETTAEMSEDEACYGQGYCTLIIPFKRFLVCTGITKGGERKQICGFRRLLSDAYYQPGFEFRFPDFYSICPHCKAKTKNDIDDKKDDRKESLRLKRWSPHEIDVLFDPYSHARHYLWRIPEQYKNDIKNWKPKHGLHLLENIPKEVMKTIQYGTQFRFHDNAIFHMRSPTLGGIDNKGYGLPRIIGNLQSIFNVQVLKKQNEAIGMDFVVPLRVISPAQQIGMPQGGEGIFSVVPGDNIASNINRMLGRWRRDPASIQTFNTPLQMQFMGGNAQQLAPKDLLEYGESALMDEIDVPAELWRGSLQLQSMPIAIRLFESSNRTITLNHDAFLRWVTNRVCKEINAQVPESVYYKPVSIVDDEQKRQLMMQMFSGAQLSGRTAYKEIDQDWHQQQEAMAEEAVEVADIQAKAQKKMEQRGLAGQLQPGSTASAMSGMQGGAGGAPGGQGDPSGGGGGGMTGGAGADATGGQMMGGASPQPVSSYLQQSMNRVPNDPTELQALADSLATQLVQTPEPTRGSELSKLRRFNSFLHEIVTSKMAKARQQIRSDAGNQAMQQAQGGGGQPPPQQ